MVREIQVQWTSAKTQVHAVKVKPNTREASRAAWWLTPSNKHIPTSGILFLSGTTFELCYSSPASFNVFKTLKSAIKILQRTRVPSSTVAYSMPIENRIAIRRKSQPSYNKIYEALSLFVDMAQKLSIFRMAGR
ncbi:hypothetical protein KCU81_g275, partial [Aureobasidium melanogenum]